jgi:hypothetical protein
MSEAAFEGGLLYSVFLLGAIVVPGRAKNRVRSAVSLENATATDRLPNLS